MGEAPNTGYFLPNKKKKMVRHFKAEPKRKSSSLISRGNGPRDEAEVTNRGKACVLFLIISNLEFGFLAKS